MKIKGRQISDKKTLFLFLGGLLSLFSSVQACTMKSQNGIDGSGQQMYARLNLTQLFPGEQNSSLAEDLRATIECDGRTNLVLTSLYEVPSWTRLYNQSEINTAKGNVHVIVTSAGRPTINQSYDIVRGNRNDIKREMGVQTGKIQYNFHVFAARGELQIFSEKRLESVPPADSNIIVRIIALGGVTGGGDLRISSGITPKLNYCTASYISHRVVGSPVNFGVFSAGSSSESYNRTKRFSIEVTIDSRCHKPVTPIVSFSNGVGGTMLGNSDTISFNNGLQFKIRQSNGREVRFNQTTKHSFPELRPGPPQSNRKGILSFDATLSKREGVPVTSGKFNATIRYHLEYR